MSGTLPVTGAAIAGLCVGLAAGFTSRRGRLCSFGAVEDAWMGGDTRRLRVFGLALAIALGGTQLLVLGGLLEPSMTTYLPQNLPWLSVIVGSLLFGMGMALVGTCGFGSLVRLGGGDLRSLVVLLVYGAIGYATLRGVLSNFRIGYLESFTLALTTSGPGDLITFLADLGLPLRRDMIAFIAAIALIVAVVADRRLLKKARLVFAGIVLGIGVVVGWISTGVFVDDFEMARPHSLTFVAPVARAFIGSLVNAKGLVDFGFGTVFGTIVGSGLAAYREGDFRWEAFDDHHEMRRHLTGAVLMGFGGILAGGCTIGQGLTAGSLMALSWPLAIAGFMVGARLGIEILLEGSLLESLRQRLQRFTQSETRR